MNRPNSEQIEALLPQTQCKKCGYNGCKPYAQAISKQQADINQCPPGGQQGIIALAALLGVTPKPLNPLFGRENPREVAVIIEQDCIGCTRCLPPCPVDAIIGASQQMHTVISSACTGCELCLAACPVDCISMQPIKNNIPLLTWHKDKADLAKKAYQNKVNRLASLQSQKMQRMQKQKQDLKKLK